MAPVVHALRLGLDSKIEVLATKDLVEPVGQAGELQVTRAEANLVYAAMELAKKHPELAELVLQANATVAFVSGSTKKVWMGRCAFVWDQVRSDHRVREMRKAVVKVGRRR